MDEPVARTQERPETIAEIKPVLTAPAPAMETHASVVETVTDAPVTTKNSAPKTEEIRNEAPVQAEHKAEIEAPVQAESKAKSSKPVTAETAAPVENTDKPEKAEKKPRPPRSRKPAAVAKSADLAASGLQLVETKADIAKPAVAPEEKAPKVPRKPAAWQQKAGEQAKDEPLVMVETQK
jgi:ribonuclease E